MLTIKRDSVGPLLPQRDESTFCHETVTNSRSIATGKIMALLVF
jgi:hypothetical protein